MVNLTRIYTRTGDDGTTALGDLSRVGKNDLRLVAYADVDEANCAIGVALAAGGCDDDVRALLGRVQNELFDVGADLCTPVVADPEYPPLRVEQAYVDRLEAACDSHNARLDKLRSFVLPGGTFAAAQLHVARTVVRRAERSTWAALAEHGDSMNPLTAMYLNRLSDLLFILARVANLPTGVHDVTHSPGIPDTTPPPDGTGNVTTGPGGNVTTGPGGNVTTGPGGNVTTGPGDVLWQPGATR